MKRYYTKKKLEQLVNDFTKKELPLAEWTHHAHLATCFWFLDKYTPNETIGLMRSRIIEYNSAFGGVNDLENGYHETLTIFWVKTLSKFKKKNKNLTLLQLINNFLNDEPSASSYPMHFYSKRTLFSKKARSIWVAPK
jgi:hypothetical protein